MNRLFPFISRITAFLTLLLFTNAKVYSQGVQGYYQYPTIHSETIVFSAEGDLWTVPVSGGLAQRLTTHHGEETNAVISPDGKTLAFTGSYEGPAELYTMPITGGLPVRWTYEASSSTATTWMPNGDLVYTTSQYSTLPNLQLVIVDIKSKVKNRIELNQASEASFDDSGNTVYFVRPAYHRNVTKRYKGGTARKIWKFTLGTDEAIELSDKYAGESHHPMWWNGRVYFITDRDGIMNIWSMTDEGADLVQHTAQDSFDVRYASLSEGRIVYQVGADLWVYNTTSGNDKLIPITLASDMDQLREKWVKNPSQYITSVNLHPNGEQIVITSRGRVFVTPANAGRMVQLSRKEGVRYRDAVFSADGKDIVTLSDESGEFEFMKIPATGIGNHQTLTDNGEILRFTGVPSPDGKWLVYRDHNRDGWLLNIENGSQKIISTNREGVRNFSWSPDSKWLTFEQDALNSFTQINIYGIDKGESFPITTDRANSTNSAWSPDGKFIYFLSDRNFRSLVGSPWGSRQPEPYFDRKIKIYELALQKGVRSLFRPADELYSGSDKPASDNVTVAIDKDGIVQRIREVPVEPGNYRGLAVNDQALYFLSRETGIGAKTHLMALKVSNEGDKATTLTEDIRSYELSEDGKKLMIRKGNNFFVTKAGTSSISKINDSKVDLSSWSFSMDPREDWRQIFTDAWRMERDYFYDPGMHGVDWDGMYQKYLPLVDRITTRRELSDLIGRFVGELSALHTSVRGGDLRSGDDRLTVASLGARFSRQPDGYRIEHIYIADSDYPNEASPLADPYLDVNVGDVITHVNGSSSLSETDLGALFRNQVGKQVRIGLKSPKTGDRDIIVTPLGNEYGLRYRDWEHSRRLKVDEMGEGKIGYVHLQAMGSNDISQWYKEFYPSYNRKGLIIDVRNNRGGNIESFILEKLLRKAWFYWKGRVGEPYPNMQYAFTGHMVVLVNANTASDGEAFAEGFRRLDMGKIIGTRTWGGEIWLGSANRLSDGGLARAPMSGVYGLESKWLIEGHGVDPDIVVDNLPHATFMGQDAQLDAAIQHLKDLISEDPRDIPELPAYPDLSFNKNE